MSQRAQPGGIKTLIQDLITDTENNIKSNLAEAAEIIDPKE
jgi:hypothetical protein